MRRHATARLLDQGAARSDAGCATTDDRHTLAAAYHCHGGAVYRIARQMCGAEQAEQITVAVFTATGAPERRTWDSATAETVQTGLLAAAHRLAARAVRADRGRSGDRPVSAQGPPVSGPGTYRALAELSDLARQAIHLAYFDGYTFAQIAALLNQPESAIKSQVRDGMVQLAARRPA